ncbi:MAG TPA: TraB/GumN family protein [Cytophagales bacterium]|nr:TraB/GumN family protein [Cytophagales bacterium]
MKKQIINLGLILGIVASAQDANSLLWKFYKKGQKPSYLYGTYHSKKIDRSDYNDSLEAKIRKVERVYVELDEAEMANASQLLATQFMLPEGTTLKTLLTKQEYERYAKFAEAKLGPMYESLDVMHPLLVSLMLETFDDLAVEQDTSRQVVDQYIEKYAKANKVEVRGLETAEEQTAALRQISLEESVKSLMETVDLNDQGQNLKAKLETLYKTEDLKGIAALINDPKMKETMDMIKGPLLDTRNKVMVDRVDEFITKTKKNTLVAVGALHLVGKTGLIEVLRTRGYTVEPILAK